jgi:hypothetical protein
MHIDLVKSYWERGYRAYLWSANGPEWAARAMEKLNLQKYIYHVMCKPVKFVDDKKSTDDILGTRVYLEYK